MLQLIVPTADTSRIAWRPLDNARARMAMVANGWKGSDQGSEENRRLLVRTIVNEMLRPGSFVLFHIDADVAWTNIEKSENRTKFQQMMVPAMKGAIHYVLARDTSGRSAEEVFHRFHLLVPSWCIESWTFQNLNEAAAICRTEGCGTCGPLLTRWAEVRADIDEYPYPKEGPSPCLQDRFNLRLVTRGYPSKAAYDAGTSFFASVNELLECHELVSLLQQTRGGQWTKLPLPSG
jgi:hypothetical protein